MITLEELFARLSRGPLSNIAIGNNGSGTILADKQPGLVEKTNDALLRLFSRFVLLEKNMKVRQFYGTHYYLLDVDHTYSSWLASSTRPYLPFVQDTAAEPYTGDLIRITQAYDNCGMKLRLNDDSDKFSLFTPKVNQLQISNPIADTFTYLVYQARHQKLDPNEIDLKAKIDIPDILEEALVMAVSAKVYSEMNGQEHQLKFKEYDNSYKEICAVIESRDLVNETESYKGYKFDSRGFV